MDCGVAELTVYNIALRNEDLYKYGVTDEDDWLI